MKIKRNLSKAKNKAKTKKRVKKFDFWKIWNNLSVKKTLRHRLKIKTPKGKKEKISKIRPAKSAEIIANSICEKKIKRKIGIKKRLIEKPKIKILLKKLSCKNNKKQNKKNRAKYFLIKSLFILRRGSLFWAYYKQMVGFYFFKTRDYFRLLKRGQIIFFNSFYFPY